MLVAQAARNLARFGFSPEISISEVYREMRLHRANIVLIGMPHSGKSTLGKALSEVLGKEFVDIDQRLEARGRDLGSLYPDVEAFRKEEAEETIRHAKGWNQVIACGGASSSIRKPSPTSKGTACSSFWMLPWTNCSQGLTVPGP